MTPRKPVRCLVIQLARTSDTLQSLMALRAAKQLYPELEIHFVVREGFAAAARRVPWLETVTVLPTERLLRPILDGKQAPEQSMGDLARWIAPLAGEAWDLLINWSFSEASSWLAALLPARVKLGYSRHRDGTVSAVDGWSQYVQAVIQQQIPQNIHLIDVLTTQILTALQIHVGDPVDAADEAVTSRTFFSLELQPERFGPGWKDHSRKWLGIQLGTGDRSKEWDPENWAGLAALVLARHADYSIVLLGTQEDRIKAERFMAKLHANDVHDARVISLVGQTDFDLWATVVGRCQWLMSADTAAIHLASILGTRVLSVAVGPSRSAETGPYGNGHYVISSAKPCDACQARGTAAGTHSCRTDISFEAVYATWAYGSSEWAHRRQINLETQFSRLGWTSHLSTIRAERSRIRGTADGGGVVFENLLDRPLEIDGWIAQAIGSVARAWYCGWLPPIGQEITRGMIAPTLVSRLRELEDSTGVLLKICQEAGRTSRDLQSKAKGLKSAKIMPLQDREEISVLGAKLAELDALIERLGRTHSALAAFAGMSKVLMHNLAGPNLAELGRESALSYEQLGQGVSLVKDWVSHTLKLARPVAVVRELRAEPVQEHRS